MREFPLSILALTLGLSSCIAEPPADSTDASGVETAASSSTLTGDGDSSGDGDGDGDGSGDSGGDGDGGGDGGPCAETELAECRTDADLTRDECTAAAGCLGMNPESCGFAKCAYECERAWWTEQMPCMYEHCSSAYQIGFGHCAQFCVDDRDDCLNSQCDLEVCAPPYEDCLQACEVSCATGTEEMCPITQGSYTACSDVKLQDCSAQCAAAGLSCIPWGCGGYAAVVIPDASCNVIEDLWYFNHDCSGGYIPESKDWNSFCCCG